MPCHIGIDPDSGSGDPGLSGVIAGRPKPYADDRSAQPEHSIPNTHAQLQEVSAIISLLKMKDNGKGIFPAVAWSPEHHRVHRGHPRPIQATQRRGKLWGPTGPPQDPEVKEPVIPLE